MREEEIMQITPALWGWYTYGQGEQGWGANRAPGVSGGKHGRQRGLAPARSSSAASRAVTQ